MTLGQRDTRQQAGYSRDIYVPLAARDVNPGFWGWPEKFKAGRSKTVGNYRERRLDLLVRQVSGQAQLVEGIRLYYYDVKHEFRLNCTRLVVGAKPGDLLVIQKSPLGTSFEGRAYEYEATVIAPPYAIYRTLSQACSNEVKGSPKRWGYV